MEGSLKREKVIHFKKDIVDKNFGFAAGTTPFTMGRTILILR
jgi:hypothetical protein